MRYRIWVLVLATTSILLSCGVNSNIMFKEAEGTEVNSSEIPLKPTDEYRLSVDDKITFTLATNEGAVIIDGPDEISGANGTGVAMEYVVRSNGKVELPKLGKVYVAGLTVEECEDTLEALFSVEYQDPFVQVHVTNQRVIVFTGNGSDAQVIPLTNSNTTLLEVIALAGGIADRGKANTVKLIRKVDNERKVYVMDLSVMEGLKYTDLVVQGNDYIYVEPSPELAKEVVEKVLPITSLITTTILLITFLLNF